VWSEFADRRRRFDEQGAHPNPQYLASFVATGQTLPYFSGGHSWNFYNNPFWYSGADTQPLWVSSNIVGAAPVSTLPAGVLLPYHYPLLPILPMPYYTAALE
jgi:hypothetical protein